MRSVHGANDDRVSALPPKDMTASPHDGQDEPAFVSRGGLKLQHALREFAVSPVGWACADFGCSTGGFTDCLLRHGATKVYAIDTAYGELAWKLRNDPRVVVMERTNCLHAIPPAELQGIGVDLVVIDASWTPQRLVIPAAERWLATSGKIITLIKPHYELKDLGEALPKGGVLAPEHARDVAQRVADRMSDLAMRVLGLTPSPILGGGGKSKSSGNVEYLALLARA